MFNLDWARWLHSGTHVGVYSKPPWNCSFPNCKEHIINIILPELNQATVFLTKVTKLVGLSND